jgi:hypothetical protein
MDIILFTSPLKYTKNSTIEELKYTCKYYGIDTTNKKKQELYNSLDGVNYIHTQTKIKYNNLEYYINSSWPYQSFIKTYDDIYRTVYQVCANRSKIQHTISYSKSTKKLEFDFKTIKSDYVLNEIIKLKNIIGYLELKHIFTNFYFTDLIKDIFLYMCYIYRNYIELPNINYIIY